MENHHNHESLEDTPNLELSQEELASLLNDLKEQIKKHGVYQDMWGHLPPLEEERQPGTYSVVLPNEVIDGALDDVVVHYAEPYRVDEEDTETRESVEVRHEEKLDGGITHAQTYVLRHVDGEGFSADIHHEYSDEAGRRISPNNVVFDGSEEAVEALLEDIGALERPMMLGDTEQLRAVVDYLRQ